MVQLRPPFNRGPPRVNRAGNHPTMKIVRCPMNKPPNKLHQKPKRRKQKITRQITGCKGIGIKLSVRTNIPPPNPYSFSCSLRCRHPLHLQKGRYSSGAESDRQDDWISEEVYRRYTETDSRPQTPEVHTTIISRKSTSVTRSRSIEDRKCSTPEPETKQCVFHQRRVLVLDLRRVKSVDAITRQSSFTPATSFDDSTAADDEPDDNASSVNPESSHFLSPRNLSVSRSVTPKNLKAVRRSRRLKDRSNSPLEYERPTSPKILEGKSDVVLPPDFLSFLTSNYAQVEAIKEKIKEFEEQEALKRRAFMRGRYRDGFVSTDSWSTDKDTTEIISAKIVPKVKIEESFDSIDFDIKATDVGRWLTPDPEFDPGEEVLQDLSRKYPLIVFSRCQSPAQEEQDTVEVGELDDLSRSKKAAVIQVVHPFMVVSGMKLRQEARSRSNIPEIDYPLRRSKPSPKSKLNRRKSTKKKSNKAGEIAGSSGRSYSRTSATTPNARNDPADRSRQKPKSKSSSTGAKDLASATLGELTEELYKRYYSNPGLQLTLPPLHSSVLTLLGQRPNSKLPSGSLPPGASLELNEEVFDEEASGIRLKQKLRRHGRKDKYDREDFDEDDLEGSGEGTRAPSPIPSLSASQQDGAGAGAGSRRRSKVLDDPHDTQVSVMSQRDDMEDLPKDDDRSSLGVGSFVDLRERQFSSYMLDTAKSLHAILDEELVGTEWNLGDMNHLEGKISQMKDELNEYETRFKAGNISMKEDLWLALPRTWSKSSATFGVPTDIRILAKLHPLEYIEKYVFISEPRKMLYSLIFHRYRTMENPTGKTITYNCVPKALSEVLGRQMSENEKVQLETDLLKISDANLEITETLFRGICAVTERVFGDYCLEDCNECFTCLRHPKKDKRRCHKNTRNQVETVDLNYVVTKIKEGRVNPLLSQLLQTIFERSNREQEST